MHRLSVAEQYKAIAQAREIAKQYEQGAISLARMNSQMKRLQQQQRKINGNRKAQLAPVKGGVREFRHDGCSVIWRRYSGCWRDGC